MNYSSLPPVLYLEEEDDDDGEDKGKNNTKNNPNVGQRSSFATHMSLKKPTSSSNTHNQFKRKLINTDVRINSSVMNSSKRQRNDHYRQQSSRNVIDPDPEPELILLDPDEYVIEEPDPPQYCSFDWTIQPLAQSASRMPPPPPPPSSLLPSSSTQTSTRISSMSKTAQRSFDKPNNTSITNSNNHFVQQQQKPTAVPVSHPSSTVIPLHLSNPTTSTSRTNMQRNRSVKDSRFSYERSTSLTLPMNRPTERSVVSKPSKSSLPSSSSSSSTTTTTITNTSSINSPTLATRRQIVSGTGLFSAYHDSKYYHCNICKFKSVTSSTLLQHLFTHMLFCDQCSFYTYSSYNLSQHMLEKHSCDSNEPINNLLNPKTFDLLYVTRCADGTFALCMDSSLNQPNKLSNNDQRLVISSGTPTDQCQNKQIQKKDSQRKDQSNQDVNDIVVVTENSNSNHRLSKHSKGNEKQNQTYVLMKHRRCYVIKKLCRLHSLTLEYNICREHTIRQMCHTQNILKRRKILTKVHKTQFIDEISSCLRRIVNQIVDSEYNSDQSSSICTLPNDILNSVLSTEHLNTITGLLRLNNKYENNIEQNELYEKEHALRDSRKHIFILSSTERNNNDLSIISSLHSSLTNGDSVFTQPKLRKLSTNHDNTHRFLITNSNSSIQSSNNTILKSQKKSTTIQVAPPKPVSLRPVIPKPSCTTQNHSSFTKTTDRNNNSVTSTNLKVPATKTPSIIVLD